MEAGKKKLLENKNILLMLIVVLLIVSAVQSVFLVKLYRTTDRNSAIVELDKDFDKYFGLQDDFFKRFDSHSWDPFEELESMRGRMERMFDDSHNRFRFSPFFDEGKRSTNILPQTDMEEKDDRYIVTMNIPGSDKAEIKIDLEDDKLTVRAKIKMSTAERKGNSFLRMERSTGSFQRTLTLPGPVEEGKMETKYEDGVLTIILPKTTGVGSNLYR